MYSNSKSIPVVRTPCSDLQKRAIASIAPGRVTYIPATAIKRFANSIQAELNPETSRGLTEKQRKYLWAVVKRFRRQIRDKSLVAHAEEINGHKRG